MYRSFITHTDLAINLRAYFPKFTGRLNNFCLSNVKNLYTTPKNVAIFFQIYDTRIKEYKGNNAVVSCRRQVSDHLILILQRQHWREWIFLFFWKSRAFLIVLVPVPRKHGTNLQTQNHSRRFSR